MYMQNLGYGLFTLYSSVLILDNGVLRTYSAILCLRYAGVDVHYSSTCSHEELSISHD